MIVAKTFNVLMLVALLIVTPLFVLASVKNLDHVNSYEQKITSLQRVSDPTEVESLPYARNFLDEGRTNDPIEWVLSVVGLKTQSNPAMWIPHYTGQLVIKYQGVVLYDSRNHTGPEGKYRGQGAIISLPAEISSENIDLRIELYPSRGAFASLSQIYLGGQSDFQVAEGRQYFFYNKLASGITFIQIFVWVIIFTLVLHGALRREALGACLVVSFYTLMAVGRMWSQGNHFSPVSAYLLLLSPYSILGLSIIYRDVVHGVDRTINNKHLLIVALICALPFIFGISGLIDLRKINIILSIPILTGGMVVFLFLSIYQFLRRPTLHVGAFLIAVWSFSFCFSLDLGHGVGLIDRPFHTAQFSVIIFLIFTAYFLVINVLKSKSLLVSLNDKLNIALQEQARRLRIEFSRSAQLLEEAAIAKRGQELHRELHDGVLTYLAVINSVSTASEAGEMQMINKMSRSATNEIRLILAVEPGDSDSLMIALNTFRAQLIEPLKHLGVKVHWSTREFIDCDFNDTSIVLDVIRILQEAIHNAFFRAGCTELEIKCTKGNDGMLSITVTNTGGKTYIPNSTVGFGIKNMRNRAAKIGGAVSLSACPGGAVLEVRFPKNGRRTQVIG